MGIARIFSPIAAGGRKRHKNRYNDCCYDDYDDDYRRRRRRSALERGPTLDDLDDRGGGYGKVNLEFESGCRADLCRGESARNIGGGARSQRSSLTSTKN